MTAQKIKFTIKDFVSKCYQSHSFLLIWRHILNNSLWKTSLFCTVIEEVIQRCSIKIVFFEISQNSQENACARVSFLIKLQANSCNCIKKETLARYFPVDLAKFLRTPFLQKNSGGCFCS